MSTRPGQSHFEIAPPIVVNEHGDVQAFPSVRAVTQYVEVVDILNNEYTFHDSTGRVLAARVHKGKIDLVPTSRVEPDSESIRTDVIGMLRFHGVPEEGLSGLPFSELARLLLEESKR
jgi:hypothetical protein